MKNQIPIYKEIKRIACLNAQMYRLVNILRDRVEDYGISCRRKFACADGI